jgi:hypothetical protein
MGAKAVRGQRSPESRPRSHNTREGEWPFIEGIPSCLPCPLSRDFRDTKHGGHALHWGTKCEGRCAWWARRTPWQQCRRGVPFFANTFLLALRNLLCILSRVSRRTRPKDRAGDRAFEGYRRQPPPSRGRILLTFPMVSKLPPRWQPRSPLGRCLDIPGTLPVLGTILGLQALLKVNIRLATTDYLSNGYDGL